MTMVPLCNQITCADCGIRFAFDAELFNRRYRDGGRFWCPNGHFNTYRETEADRIRRERDLLKQRNAQLTEERDRAVTAERMARARETKERNARHRVEHRTRHGVCPCCSRSFQNLSRHMTTKHPEFGKEAAE